MAKLWVTILGLGFFPFAPGTIGSLVGVIFLVLLIQFLQPEIFVILMIIMFFISWFLTERYVSQIDNKQDPSEVIIDELIGQWISLIPLLYLYHIHFPITIVQTTKLILASFLLFRFFDIIKPWPINLIDRQVSSFSIIFDDVIAGLFVVAVIYIYISWSYL